MASKAFQPWTNLLDNVHAFPFSPFLALNKTTLQMYSELATENMNAANEFWQCHLDMMKEVKHVQGMEGLMQMQTHYATELVPKFHQYTQNLMEIIAKYASEYNKCLTKEKLHSLHQKEHKH